MYKRILALLALIVLLGGVTIAAAQVVTETPFGPTQWCYEFNFRTNDHEALVVYGDHATGTGFKSELIGGQHTLLLQIDYPVTVDPVGVVWRFDRGLGTGSAPIDVTASLETFGIEHAPDPILFQISPDYSPEDQFTLIELSKQNPEDFGTIASASVIASNAFTLSSLRIYGNGVNPFPFDHCGPGTATPTQTATEPGTPTATATQGACLLPGQPTPTPAGGPTATPEWLSILEDFEAASPVSPWVTWQSDDGNAVRQNYGPPLYYRWVRSDYQSDVFVSVEFNFPYAVVVDHVQFFRAVAGTYASSYGVETFVSGAWVGFGPEGPPGPDDKRNYYGQVETTRLRVYGAGSSIDYNTYPPAAALDDVYVHYREANPAAPTLPACTATPTITPSVSPTPSNTPTPFTLTPTFTRTPTRTPFPIIIPTIAPTATAGPSSTPITPTAGPPTATLGPGITPTGASGDFVPFDTGEGGDGLRGLGGGVLGVASNLWSRATGWTTNMADGIGRLTDAWATSVPTPLPYMPRCRSNPLANELCAIWYILTFTVFSGELGSLIIPMAVLVVDVYFLFVFIRLSRAILARARRIRG